MRWSRRSVPASPLHPDFGSGTWDGAPIGIPITRVPSTQPLVSVKFTYSSQSDQGPYPVPAKPQIEGGPSGTDDRHVLIVQQGTCKDFELFNARPVVGSTSWRAGSGAIFSMESNALRPAGWTSADAAGLPILPGLAREGEVAGGVISHALRMTVPVSAMSYLWPARHEAGSPAGIVPMGLRLRLKASVDLSSFPASDQVILQALKTYGAIVADNGSPWYLSGVPSAAVEQRHAPPAHADQGLRLRGGRRVVPPSRCGLWEGEPRELLVGGAGPRSDPCSFLVAGDSAPHHGRGAPQVILNRDRAARYTARLRKRSGRVSTDLITPIPSSSMSRHAATFSCQEFEFGLESAK